MKSEKIINLSFFLALGVVWQHSRLPWIPEATFHPSFLVVMQVTNKMMEVIVPCFFFYQRFFVLSKLYTERLSQEVAHENP